MHYKSEKYAKEVKSLIGKLWDAAELRFEEFTSAGALTAALSKHGYKVEQGIGGLPTAFKAVYGQGKPVIGLLAEYDALDGLSQKADQIKYDPREGTTHGHGCGHHLLGAGIVGAAFLLKDYLEKNPNSGTVIVFGCPGEEGGAGKTFMAREGVFNNIDIALTWHPSTINAAMVGSMLANVQVYFNFHGLASHAAASPQKGRSALDAIEIMDIGTNYLREHMDMTDRIHYAITNSGGISPNVVQAEGEVLYLIRSKTNESVQILFDRVKDIAKGAALITGTKVDWHIDNALSNVVPNDTLGQLMYDKMVTLGVPKYTEEEINYIKKFRKVIGKNAGDNDCGLLPEFDMLTRKKLCTTHPMGDFILPFEPKDVVVEASSDMGDVSRIAPLIQLQCACFCLGTLPHSWLLVAQGKSAYALKGTLFAAQVLADGAIDLFENSDLIKTAQEENLLRNNRKPYVCPMPDDIHPFIFQQNKK